MPTRSSVFAVLCALSTSFARADIANGDFAAGFSGWTTAGSTTTRGAVGSNPDIVPPDGDGSQAQISNSGGANPTTTQLEGFLGLNAGSIAGVAPNGDPTQGSAIWTTFGAGEFGGAGARVTFSWNFLTDEDLNSTRQDFAFVSVTSSDGFQFIQLLSFVNDPALQTASDGTTNVNGLGFGGQNGRQLALGYNTDFSFTIPNPGGTIGTYTLGFGVLDALTNNVNSILYVDAVSVEAVPEPSSLFLLLLGVTCFRRRLTRLVSA